MTDFDEQEVYKFFDIFKENNQLTEIRLIPNVGNITASGYFTNAKTLIEAVRPYAKDYNVYFTLNRINPDVYGRPQKDIIITRPKNTTTDGEIIGRDFVLLDLDSKRATGVAATEEQLHAAKMKANDVYKYLLDMGFNEPIVVCSGSGVHLYLRCALKASDENTELVKNFLGAMAMLFSDEHVEVDTKVYNNARISRVMGYYNRKGAKNDKKRPQRLCSFVKVPKEIKVNEKEYFEKVAKLFPEEEKPSRENNYRTEKFDLDAFIAKHNIQVTRIENIAGGKKYILDHCLFNESHRGKDAVIFQRDNGAIGYCCLHAHCANKTWKDVRLLYEPDAYDHKDYSYRDRYHSHYEKPSFTPIKESEEKGKKWLSLKDVKRIDITEQMSIPTGYHELDKKIVGLFAGELTVLSGLNASGKTSWLDCLALNVIQAGYKCAVWSGELQGWRFQNWLNQMAAGKRYVKKKEGYDNLYYTPSNIAEKIDQWLDKKLFLYNNEYGSKWEQLFSDIKELVDKENVHLIILDNLATLSIDGYEGEKYSKQTQFIIDIKDYAKQKNIHVVLVCHPRKQGDFLRKESISGTADLTNIADNVFIIHRVGNDFEKRAGEFFGQAYIQQYLQFNSVLEISKNRQMGIVDYLVGMYYEVETRRLKNEIAENIIYGWQEDAKEQNIKYDNNNAEQGDGLPWEVNLSDVPF